METLIYNRRFSERAAVFEIGRVYLPEFPDADGRPREQRRLSIGLCGPRGLSWFKNIAGAEETFDFLDLKGVIELLLRKAGVAAAEVSFERRAGNGTFGPWCATVRSGEKIVGVIGELDNKVIRGFGLKAQRVCAAELLIDPLVREPWTAPIAADFSRYPMVVEDLAFIVDQSVTVAAVERAMHAAGGKLLLDAQLFDLFAGPPLAEGKKSLAFKVRYQGADATLSEQQIVSLRQAIVNRVEKELAGILRTA
jgi:phenylalanyl-tRNA synthetase beta chain